MKKNIPWETEEVCKKRKELQDAAKDKNSDPTDEKIAKFKTAQMLLTETYEKEHVEYLQKKIDTIERASYNKKSAVAWKTVNEISNSIRFDPSRENGGNPACIRYPSGNSRCHHDTL